MVAQHGPLAAVPGVPAGTAMPSSVLWAVDLFGRVYTLSTAGQYWELCKDTQLEFKRVSAATQCCWGIACDNQVYVYVCASDVPIRRQEEAYENQVGLCARVTESVGRLGNKACTPQTPSPSPCSQALSCPWVPGTRVSVASSPGQAAQVRTRVGSRRSPGAQGVPCPPLLAPRGTVSCGRSSALWGCGGGVLADPRVPGRGLASSGQLQA